MAEIKPHLTPEAYLEQERQADFKSEYYRGETFAMSGARRNHVVLTSALAALLIEALGDRDCVVLTSDMRVHIPSTTLYTYPDLAVVCGEEIYLDGTFDTLLNPVLIVEVLSESTEAYDRGQKFELYRPIASLREYALVAQDRKRIEVFRLNERGHWELFEAGGDGAAIELASLGVTVHLDALYRQVRFEEANGPRPPHPSDAPRRA